MGRIFEDGKDGGVVLDGYCGEIRASPASLRSASPSRGEGEGGGVLCFSLVSRVRVNDGWVA